MRLASVKSFNGASMIPATLLKSDKRPVTEWSTGGLPQFLEANHAEEFPLMGK